MPKPVTPGDCWSPGQESLFLDQGRHITVQFTAVNGMWLPVSVDAIAMVRLVGIYTLSGRDLTQPAPLQARLAPDKHFRIRP